MSEIHERDELERRFIDLYGAPPALRNLDLLRSVLHGPGGGAGGTARP